MTQPTGRKSDSNSPDGLKTPITESLPMLERLNQTVGKIKEDVLRLQFTVGKPKEEEKSSLAERVSVLEKWVFSRNQVITIRKKLEQINIEFAEETSIPSNSQNYHQQINAVVAALKQNKDFYLKIQGHSNPHAWIKGGAQKSLERSLARAGVVQQSIIDDINENDTLTPDEKQKVIERLTVEALSDTKPYVSGKNSKNCRVTFVVGDYVPDNDQAAIDFDAASIISSRNGNIQ